MTVESPPNASPTSPVSVADPRIWNQYHRNRVLHFPARKILKSDTRIFAMGSCFAMEIRRALQARGRIVYPDYPSVSYDGASQVFDKIPHSRDALQHYDTFSMLQEFEAALGVWADRSAGYWSVTNAPVNKILNSPEVFQDPYRKLVYAATRPSLENLCESITQVIRQGLDSANVIVLTLGLTEVWQHNGTGRHLCKPPGTGYGGGMGNATFRQSTFLENYENMRKLLDLVFARYPDKEVIISVSPVALGETFSVFDVGTANTESKSILRAVAGQICREYEQVQYFPSYEMSMMTAGVFEDDGRHVRPAFADQIVAAFIGSFSEET